MEQLFQGLFGLVALGVFGFLAYRMYLKIKAVKAANKKSK